MSEEPVEFNGEEKNESDDSDWGKRILCSDESCIGVIGPDGRCKECGLPYEKAQTEDEAVAAEPDENQDAEPDENQDAEPDENQDAEPDEKQDADAAGVDVPPTSNSDDDWENRTLCSDESCIGVIGPDGRCKECGKPYEG
ncbi:MAG: hypothetical protein PVF09_15980 [Desulfobacterales bacterium]|jgi:hypothetical protein